MSKKGGFPKEFTLDSYVAWHEQAMPADFPLKSKLEKLLSKLKKDSRNDLSSLMQLLIQLKERTESECCYHTKNLLTGAFRLPTSEIAGKADANFEGFFKPANSVVNKMWRLNSKGIRGKYVSLANVKEQMTDLIRTSVVAPSLFHAKEYAGRMRAWETIVPEKERREYFSCIKRIGVDEEAKFASGYFAYHCSVEFKSGVIVEVQIFSILNEAWRMLSHKLYEKTRNGEKLPAGMMNPEGRFVSLGHMLHLADCEMADLVEALKDRV